MRIAVSADNDNGLDSIVSPHFGRCPYYILVDVEGQAISNVSAANNPYYGHHEPGQVPTFINGHGVHVMLTGGMGRRAVAFFQQFGIEPVTGAAGTVRQALEGYLGGTLQGAEPCKESQQHTHDEDHNHYEKDEVGRLREEVEMLQRQLSETMKYLEEME